MPRLRPADLETGFDRRLQQAEGWPGDGVSISARTYAVWYAYSQLRYCHGRTFGLAHRTDTIEFQSGHVYQVRLERNEWSARCGAVRRYLSDPRVWIEDDTTDQVVAGEKAFKGTP